MKEFNPIILGAILGTEPAWSKVEEEIVRQVVAKKRKPIGQLTPQRGQKLFSFNVNTSVIDTPKLSERVVVTQHGNVTERYLDIDSGCIYCCAINKNNAMRKFIKQLDELMGNKSGL